jgi:hypothetical protein
LLRYAPLPPEKITENITFTQKDYVLQNFIISPASLAATIHQLIIQVFLEFQHIATAADHFAQEESFAK